MTLRSSTNSFIRTWRRYFPLVSVESVVVLFEEMLQGSDLSDKRSVSNSGTMISEPNLAFVSIILGYIEMHITTMEYPLEAAKKVKSNSINSRKRNAPLRSNRNAKRTNLRVSPSKTVIESDCPSLSPNVVEVPSNTSSNVLCSAAHFSNTSDLQCPGHSLESVPLMKSECAFPVLCYEDVELFYQKFYSMIVHHPKLSAMSKFVQDPVSGKKETCIHENTPSSRRLIKSVCDVLCENMSPGRQREYYAHAQSIYSLLKNGQLDSFGLAYTTVAACQLLGYADVHLALSEDHAWVEFGPPDRRETADVSVMPALEPSEAISPPKFQYDDVSLLCPPPVRLGHLMHSWLYLNGYPVVCDPQTLSVAAAVTAIQPCGLSKSVRPRDQSVNSTENQMSRNSPIYSVETVSPQLVGLKRKLLWLVYREGLLSKYPLGLTNLADIEEGYPSDAQISNLPYEVELASSIPGIVEVRGGINLGKGILAPPRIPLELLLRAVDIDRLCFQNQHVYPYIYLANFLHRNCDFTSALRYWAEAAFVIGQYNHSSEDAEIYREFLDIATRVIPEVFKSFATENRPATKEMLPDATSSVNLLDSPLCLAYLLAFYDHLCLWEEGSVVPVLHVGWVDKLMVSLTRFSPNARTQLHIEATRGAVGEDSSRATTPSSIIDHHHPGLPYAESVVTRSNAIRGTAPSPLPVAVEEEEKQKNGSLRVLLPPVVTSIPFQSCYSTTSSSAPSMATPALSAEKNCCSIVNRTTLVHPTERQSETTAAQPPPVIPSPFKRESSKLLFPNFEDGLGEEDDFVEVCKQSIFSSKDDLISWLASGSQFRLLNPAFLMGDISAAPFVSKEEFETFQEEKGSSPAVKFNETRENIIDPKFSTDSSVYVEPKKPEIGSEADLPTGPSLGPRRSSSPASSACPSFSSIPLSPPLSPVGSLTGSLTRTTKGPSPEHVVELIRRSSHITLEDRVEPSLTPDAVNRSKQISSLDTDVVQNATASCSPKMECTRQGESQETEPPVVHLNLFSAKMSRIAKLLTSPGCLKSSTIKLTLTAQSEVSFTRRRRSSTVTGSTRWTAAHMAADCAPSQHHPAPATG